MGYRGTTDPRSGWAAYTYVSAVVSEMPKTCMRRTGSAVWRASSRMRSWRIFEAGTPSGLKRFSRYAGATGEGRMRPSPRGQRHPCLPVGVRQVRDLADDLHPCRAQPLVEDVDPIGDEVGAEGSRLQTPFRAVRVVRAEHDPAALGPVELGMRHTVAVLVHGGAQEADCADERPTVDGPLARGQFAHLLRYGTQTVPPVPGSGHTPMSCVSPQAPRRELAAVSLPGCGLDVSVRNRYGQYVRYGRAGEGSVGSPPERPDVRSLADILAVAPWVELEQHIDHLRERVDVAVLASHARREQLRTEILSENPGLRAQIRQPRPEVLAWAKGLLRSGIVAAADGTVAAVPLLSGTKIQVGVVIVTNTGESVRLVTRVFEHELATQGETAREFFENLRAVHGASNLASRALMLFGERQILIGQESDWRMIHGELIPYELRTGVGKPKENLPPVFELVRRYVENQRFIAVSESPEDLDVLNAGIILEPGEFIELRMLTDDLSLFLEGDADAGVSRAGFNNMDRETFRKFISEIGPEVAIVLLKAGHRPFLLECHRDRVEEAAALFLADALWTRGLPDEGAAVTARGFPFHIDLADSVARTMFKSGEFRSFVETRLMELGVEQGIADLDPRRTRG